MRLVHYHTPLTATFNRLSNLGGELSQLFDSQLNAWVPALDVQESKDNYTIRVEVPGLKREDIEVSLEDGELTISGERKSETSVEGTEVHRQERFYGKFSRVITLPVAVAADQVKAQYKDGILTVTLAKIEQAKPKQIVVGE